MHVRVRSVGVGREGVYDTLMESDTVDPSGHTEGDTRPVSTWSDTEETKGPEWM